MLRLLASLAVASLCLLTAFPVSAADDLELTIGTEAPDLDIEHWLSNGEGKFAPVTELKEGDIYVIEFWATWCPPCVASMPHLAELQKKYADQGVTIISISDEEVETIEPFLQREVQGTMHTSPETEEGDQTDEASAESAEEAKSLTYGELTSAYCLTTDPDGSVQADYMKAAGQNGIPTAFIVGKTGVVEWIGHPMQMDDPLAALVDDAWDREAFGEQFRFEQLVDAKTMQAFSAARRGEEEQFDLVIEELKSLKAPEESKARLTNVISRLEDIMLATKLIEQPQSAIAELKQGDQSGDRVFAIALRLADNAARGGEVPDESLAAVAEMLADTLDEENAESSKLHTLAVLEFYQGDIDEARELANKALESAESGRERAMIQRFLVQIDTEQAAEAPAAETESDEGEPE